MFSRICSSHDISRFAALFIDAPAEASPAESCIVTHQWFPTNALSVNEIVSYNGKAEVYSRRCPRQSPVHSNDPAAGSPTATLLRLLVPLDAKSCATSAAGLEVLPRLSNSTLHPIGSSDGRCVQRTGTQSPCVDDAQLLGIPRSC